MSSTAAKAQQTTQVLRSSKPAILPSLLQCDFSNLEREIRTLEEAGIETLHLDIMDGHFVPNLSYGMPIVESLRRITSLVLDVHLMISHPKQYAKQFVDAGADVITFHVEAESDPRPLLDEIRAHGVLSGLAINPAIDFGAIADHVEFCDLILVMSVQAGFGGQSFNPIALERLQHLRKTLGDRVLLEVDGGVNESTIGQCVKAGADLLVVGSALFRQPDYCQAVLRLQAAMKS
jgi:ribulose-phosphate 3-epimerase